MTCEECEAGLTDLTVGDHPLEEAARFMERMIKEMPLKERAKMIHASAAWKLFAKKYAKRLIDPKTPEDADVAFRYKYISSPTVV